MPLPGIYMKMRAGAFATGTAALWLAVAPASAAGATRYVAPGGAHAAPYTNWVDAATNIQAAVDASADGDTVLVSNGTYRLDGAVTVTNGVTVQGFALDPPVVVSGQNRTRCFYLAHPGAVLRNLTIADGRAGDGGGVYIREHGAVIDCIVTNNTATNAYTSSGAAGGGGVFCWGGGLVSNCTVVRNSATNEGGGVFCDLGGEVADSRIVSNFSIDDGAGIACRTGGVVRCCVVERNETRDKGGGVQARGRATVSRCVIRDNRARFGGGLYCRDGGTAQSCLVLRNTAAQYGGGVYSYAGGVLLNCTIVSNAASNAGGAVGVASAPASGMTNCIAWGNRASSYPNVDGITLLRSAHCCWQAATTTPAGTGNIVADPLFAGPAFDDYRLRNDSPCVDTGTNQSWMASDTLDLPGNRRVAGARVDMGAYEFGAEPVGPLAITPRLSRSVPCDVTLAATGLITGSNGVWCAWDLDGDGFDELQGMNRFRVTYTYWARGRYAVRLTVTDAVGTQTEVRDAVQVGAPVVYVSPAGSHRWPYADWSTAATNLHSAVACAVALDADTVLVGPGTYPIGTELRLTNAVALVGVAGAAQTTIDAQRKSRCLLVDHPDARVNGFTVTGGYVTNSAMAAAGVCLLQGTLERCIVRGNEGGGSVPCGGVYVTSGRLLDAQIVNNRGFEVGGVFFAGIGAASGCTICTNTATGRFGAGGVGHNQMSESRLQNTVVLCNSGSRPNWRTTGSSVNWSRCCTTPLPAGTDCITNDPHFVSAATGDFRLRPTSPCIDAGGAAAGSGADVEGVGRPLDGNGDGVAAPDIGAHEYLAAGTDSDGDGLGDAEEVATHGTNPARADSDGDGGADAAELAAGTDPADPASALRIHDRWFDARQDAWVSSWRTVAGRLYTPEVAADPAAGPWRPVPGRAGLPGTGGTLSCTNPAASGPEFLRIRACRGP